jgi:hypothetical protein
MEYRADKERRLWGWCYTHTVLMVRGCSSWWILGPALHHQNHSPSTLEQILEIRRTSP